MADKLVVGAVQLSSPDPSHPWGRSLELIGEAAAKGAELICLPELFNLPYFPGQRDARQQWVRHAEETTGPTLSRMGEVARHNGVSLVIPFYERIDGQYHNSAAVIAATGDIAGVYQKRLLPHGPHAWERTYFDAPNEKSLPTFAVGSTEIGFYICYERFFPEVPRELALAGAWLLFNPAAAAGSSVRSWRSLAVSHAVSNGLYVCAVNRVGATLTGDRRFYGGTCIVDPTGEVLAEAGATNEGVIVAEVDREVVERTRQAWPFLEQVRG